MPQFASPKSLIRVGKAKRHDIDRWKEGLHLQRETRHTIEELIDRAASDRLRLARAFVRDAENLASARSGLYRAAVSRGYYAMYHAMRAAAFVFHGGDDHQEHQTLPGKTPDDMPTAVLWANRLKDARERRNAADYDPYPKAETAWRKPALALVADAGRFIVEVRSYLRTKGCRYI